jgi:hypothetical protein
VNAHPSSIPPASAAMSAEVRVAAYDWQALTGELDNYGCAILAKLLSPEECRAIAALYPDESHFRSRVHMARHGFGSASSFRGSQASEWHLRSALGGFDHNPVRRRSNNWARE